MSINRPDICTHLFFFCQILLFSLANRAGSYMVAPLEYKSRERDIPIYSESNRIQQGHLLVPKIKKRKRHYFPLATCAVGDSLWRLFYDDVLISSVVAFGSVLLGFV